MNLTRRDALSGLTFGAAVLAAPQLLAASGRPDFEELAKQTSADVVDGRSPAFASVREAMVWNPRVANVGEPAAILRVGSAADVVAAVRFAREHGLRVSVRGSGHHYFGLPLRDEALLLDLSALNGIEIDATARIVAAGPAAKGGAVVAALAGHGLGFPVGHCSDVALGGYLLNGGLGWNFGEWGVACDSIVGVEVVTPDGEFVRADRKDNADLFWSVRGAGPGFFGVVTRYHLAAYELPRAIHLYSAAFGFDSLAAVAAWLPGAIAGVHSSVEVICSVAPDTTGRTTVSVLAAGFGATPDEARVRVAALAHDVPHAARMGETVDASSSWSDLFASVNAGFPRVRMSGTSMLTPAAMSDLLIAAGPHTQGMPPPPSAITVIGLGGGAQFPRSDGAYSVGGTTLLGAYGFWNDAADDDRYTRWVDAVIKEGETRGGSYYAGETDVRNPVRAQRSYSPDAWQKLGVLRARFDPDRVFFSYPGL